MKGFVGSWLAAAAVLAFAYAAQDASALDDRAAKGCTSCDEGNGTVLVADDEGEDALEGIPEKWRKALKERLGKLPVERREAILKRIRSLSPDQRQALLERFMGRDGQGGEEKKAEKRGDKKPEKKAAKKAEKKPEKKAEKRPSDQGDMAAEIRKHIEEMMRNRGGEQFDRAREMFESYQKKNPDALKDAQKYFEMARKRFEGTGPEQREQLKKFFSLDEEKRGAMMERFRQMMDRDGRGKKDGAKKGAKKDGKKDDAKKGAKKDGKKDGAKKGAKKDGKKDGAKKGAKKDGKKDGAKKGAKKDGRGPEGRGDFLRRLPPEVRKHLEQLRKMLRERFQGRQGDRRGPDARRGGDRGPQRGGRGPEQLREALRRHMEELRDRRDGGDERGKKNEKKGKKGKKGGRHIIL